DNIDMPADNNVTGHEQHENISEDKHEDAMCRKRKRET
ncbi:TIR-NBS-LRR RCT1 resistance protein, partial [Trifolium medium]|nr:TIR-NBS-LRR RCT1 resistance protein [Trifolium medium]